MNTKLDSLNVSEAIFVLVHQYFDCKDLIKNDIARESISQSGEAERKKICKRKQTRLSLVRNMASASATVTTQV